jgi:FkbM family methyltransferase
VTHVKSRRLAGARLDLVEVALLSGLLVLCTWIFARRDWARLEPFAEDGVAELAPIERVYGPGLQSENHEEWMVRDFFNDRRGGVFVDVGANHYRHNSNTYFLDVERGWSGIAVDAQREFAPGYQRYRPRTRFFAFIASDVSGGTERLYVPKNLLVASLNRTFAEDRGEAATPRDVPTITLTDLLTQEGVNTFDFLSMDIELSEPKALAGFDIDRFKPSLVCIEAHPQVRQQILDYFARHGYVILGKYLRAEPKNLYFSAGSNQR